MLCDLHTTIPAALDEARAAADPVVRANALSLAHHRLTGPDHGEARQALAAEMIEESLRAGRRSDLLTGLLRLTSDLFLDGHPHAERHLRELRGLLRENDHPAIGSVVGAMDVMLAIRAGRLAEAEALAQECAERRTRAGVVDAAGWHATQLVAIRWYQGRLAELQPALEDQAASPARNPLGTFLLAALAVAAAKAGDRRRAAEVMAVLCENGPAALPRSSSWLMTMNCVVEAAHHLKDADTADTARRLLRPLAHLPMTGGCGVACFGSVHQALGVASLTVGDADGAIGHLRAAVKRNLALAHWPAVADSRTRLAQALRRRARSGDAADASGELAVAADEAAALGCVVPCRSRPGARGTKLVCTRRDQTWRIDLGSRSAVVDHSIGMLYLAVLVANPGMEILAVELAAGPALLDAAADGIGESVRPGPDPAHAERDRLASELAQIAGMRGAGPAGADEAERARIAVGKAIRRALARIADADAMLGEHLNASIHTGIRCYYRPV